MLRIIFILLLTSRVFSQSFYVNSPNNSFVNGNFQSYTNYYEVNVSQCTSIQQNICVGTVGITGDLAMDSNNNIYSSIGGDLYKYNSISQNCEFVTTLPPSTVSAMIADSQGNIYTAGTKIYKYSPISNNFTLLGNLPPQTTAIGDFFFFENRLFLTCEITNSNNSTLLEVNLTNPSLSTNYMSLGNLYPYAATSVNVGLNSKCYLISGNSSQSTIREVDIVSQTISPIICTLNYAVFGAASYYNQSDVLSNDQFNSNEPFVKIKNPAIDFINIDTNINKSEFKSINLFDISGRLARQYEVNNQDLDISGIQPGYYILCIELSNLQKFNLKVIIKN
ncbi:T9SS type A sorting domain-containing protein [Flavobacterium terrigena]|uniref:Por secretion system C-terminal sorting domain-containing protein n=1 Tax=Flavobacterium terrigena TaxID=402734 RepID=A0A1H6VTI6_9FLAO|nr:T9SS type A sorting domain-containing protein [Flavobacterium terrigena]SEJ07933.1 Por secretion system C-terminal sorting domain-containing protein [Flavobacterium terrigena]